LHVIPTLSPPQIFSSIDRDGDGQVDVYEFEAALDKIGESCLLLCTVNVEHIPDVFRSHVRVPTGIPLSREEAKRIVSRFSVNGTTIKFREFLK
jgi:Ca2+-binding EF-hand superfamily protein